MELSEDQKKDMMEVELNYGVKRTRRGCLQMLDQNAIKEDKATSETLKADTTGKWRRIARQHQEEIETSNLENKENWAPNGSKRGLQEEEKACEEQSDQNQGKRMRKQVDPSQLNIVKVGVASLEWPQVDQ